MTNPCCVALVNDHFVVADVETANKLHNISWVHLVVQDEASARTLLLDHFGFPELEVEDALSVDERPSLQENDDHIFLVAPTVDKDGRFIEVSCFLHSNQLVTVANAHCHEIEAYAKRLLSRKEAQGYSPGRILYEVVDRIVDAYFPWLDQLEDQVDELQDAIYEGRADFAREALALKRRLLETRRRLAPLRDVINGVLRHESSLIDRQLWPYFQDVFDHVMRLNETVDLIRDVLGSVLDANLAIVSNRLNDIMRKMTVVATLLMSAGLIAGIYGMNFKHMPELTWPLGYPFAWAAMIIVCIVELVLFRSKGWL